MKREGYLQIIEDLELEDCFQDAQVQLDVSQESINKLKQEIDEAVSENHREYNNGIDLIKLEETYYYGNIDTKVYKKVRKELLPKTK